MRAKWKRNATRIVLYKKGGRPYGWIPWEEQCFGTRMDGMRNDSVLFTYDEVYLCRWRVLHAVTGASGIICRTYLTAGSTPFLN